MMTEEYVSFETAKLLKEKGFDVWGDGSYDSGIEIYKEYSPSGLLCPCVTSKPHHKGYPAPTLQMAMKWLREVHNIFIAINMIPDTIQKHYFFKPYVGRKIYNFPLDYSVEFYTIYEEACEAGIRYCLENLI